MTESFAQLFEESLKEIETRPGSIVFVDSNNNATN
ncbi:hypothetical protein ACUOCP_14640, partial [Escherichia sp. R-CC3]